MGVVNPLHSNDYPDLAAFSGASCKFFFKKCRGRMKAVKGLGRSAASQKSLCSIKKTRTQKTGVSFLKKLLVSRNELRELENIDARHLDVLIAFCLLQVQKKDRRRTIRAHIPEVFSFKLVSAFSVQHFISMKTQLVLRDLPLG